ncbi:BolA/IbaG family iron-sulfur metabolism protein [Pasteurellaceae bacterium LIM206]|nr:BolA/IbaG family iron-sulfur metabolism protein [Pasteurellaceae bacterium LIM206]
MSRQQILYDKILANLTPHFLTVENESHMHSSDRGGESHFKVVVVSDKFDGVANVARHRMIYQLLTREIAEGIHALALHTYTLAEWQTRGRHVPQSTNCLGHGK